MYKLIIFIALISSLGFVMAYRLDLENEGFDDEEREFMEKKEAVEFMKRLFHPFSTKNEEVKRETVEVYEEKCRSIVPTKRFCPKLKTWKEFKNYENGE